MAAQLYVLVVMCLCSYTSVLNSSASRVHCLQMFDKVHACWCVEELALPSVLM